MSDPTVFCLRCAADVSALPPAARYCRRCGVPLPYRPAPPAKPRLMPPPLPAVPPASPFRQTLILVAYGRALFNLGWRYEHAPAWRRNPDEAARCYGKAARLGDAAAVQRMSLGHRDDLPPLAAVYHPPAD